MPTKDKRVTGPIAYAIDGDDKTAWGIDAGPGRRNVPRNAVFVLEKPIEVKPDSGLVIGLSMKHGGWNSDDLQTMNLGRYRLSATDAPRPRRTRCMARRPSLRPSELPFPNGRA
jgi:hypothetical protein